MTTPPRIPGLVTRDVDGVHVITNPSRPHTAEALTPDGELTIDVSDTQLDDDELREWLTQQQTSQDGHAGT